MIYLLNKLRKNNDLPQDLITQNYSTETINERRIMSSYVTKNSNATRARQNPQQYISPLEKLDKINERYMAEKVKQNNELKRQYENGECEKFQTPEHEYFYVNRKTPTDILDNLIEYVSCIQEYTIDTEEQARYRRTSLPALIQIECIHDEYPSIIMLIETLHLPEENSQTFKKIQRLCQIILSSNHTINAWGNPKEELGKFIEYKLFTKNNLKEIKPENIQQQFKDWYNDNHPSSPHRKTKPNDKFSLQSAVHLSMNQWLDKRMTMSDWSCGIDPTLETYKSISNQHRDQGGIVKEEETYRQLMAAYAVCDCMAVTKLLTVTKPIRQPRSKPEITGGVHPTNDPLSIDITLLNDGSPLSQATDHVANEHHPGTETSINIDPIQPIEKKKQTTKNTQTTKKKRNLYKFLIIRKLYVRFNTTQVKNILVDLNIFWKNVNVSNHILYLGLGDLEKKRRADELLHEDMFTKRHYYRIYRRHHRH